MAVPKVIASSEQTVAQGTSAKVYSVDFYSHTADVTVELITGGSSGTTQWIQLIDATTAAGDDRYHGNFPDGLDFHDGLYVKITGTSNVSISYEERYGL